MGTAPQARFQHRREHVRPLRRGGADRGQHRRTHRHPRHPRPLRKARRAGESALPTRPARTARRGRVSPRRPRSRKRNQARPHEAATNPQARARPAVGNRREMATDGEAVRPHCRNPARERPIRAQTALSGGCATAAYSPDGSKRAFEVPILFTLFTPQPSGT